MRRVLFTLIAFALVQSAPALAAGSVRIQHSDGSVRNYTGVTMKVVGKTLTVTSADKFSTVVISGADCTHDAALVRCSGGHFVLLQEQMTHPVAFKSATFYFNTSRDDQSLPLSTMKIAARSVVFAVETKKGTYITGHGKLDQEPTP